VGRGLVAVGRVFFKGVVYNAWDSLFISVFYLNVL
jgi:hypothetical protein